MSSNGGKGVVVVVVVMVVIVVVGARVDDVVELVCHWRGYGKCGRGRSRGSRARALK